MKNKSNSKEVFVAEISFDAKEEDLRKLFSVCGTVRAINMLTDQHSGQFSGRAFVRMATEAEARDSINSLDGARLINRCISVTAARQKPVSEPGGGAVEEKARRRRPTKGRRS